MNTYQIEIYKIEHYFYRENVQAKSRKEALKMLELRLDDPEIEFVYDDEEIAKAEVYKIVNF